MSYPGVGVGGLAKLDRADAVAVRAMHRLITRPVEPQQVAQPAPQRGDPRPLDPEMMRRWVAKSESTPAGLAWLLAGDSA